MLVHTVYFWLKRDLTDEQRKTFIGRVQELTEIPSIEYGFAGTPADTFRPVVDRTYDAALTVVFKDMQGHDAYQEHALHKNFLKDCSSLWEKVVIYDAD